MRNTAEALGTGCHFHFSRLRSWRLPQPGLTSQDNHGISPQLGQSLTQTGTVKLKQERKEKDPGPGRVKEITRAKGHEGCPLSSSEDLVSEFLLSALKDMKDMLIKSSLAVVLFQNSQLAKIERVPSH